MNQIMQNTYPMFEYYQALRNQLLEIVSDAELGFSVGGDNVTLGDLCRQIGETQTSYIRSFQTFTTDFSYRVDNPDQYATSVANLQEWYAQLDAELKDVVAALSDEEIAGKKIDRGENFELPPNIQLMVYQEALLIFYGKVSIYLKAMGKPLPQQWQDWIE
jgi:hypothetical protein